MGPWKFHELNVNHIANAQGISIIDFQQAGHSYQPRARIGHAELDAQHAGQNGRPRPPHRGPRAADLEPSEAQVLPTACPPAVDLRPGTCVDLEGDAADVQASKLLEMASSAGQSTGQSMPVSGG